MNERTGFIKDVINDFAYYQSKHNGQFPPDEEKEKIIRKRLEQKGFERKTQAAETVEGYYGENKIQNDIGNITAKPNEQKILTRFADNIVPQIEKNLGLKLTITSRYRNQQGSHHKEGRALDISLSEHSPENKIKIYEQLLKQPDIKALGTSDKNILAHFKGNSKLVDETTYDKNHGTNHKNHVHITLFNDNDFSDLTADKSGNNYRWQ